MQSDALEFINQHSELRMLIESSDLFAELKRRKALQIGGKVKFVIAGDHGGDVYQLFLDCLARGARYYTTGFIPDAEEDRLCLRFFRELDDNSRGVILQRFRLR